MNVIRGILSIFLDLFIRIILSIGDWLLAIFCARKEVMTDRNQNGSVERKSNAELESARKYREKIINKSTHYDAHRR